MLKLYMPILPPVMLLTLQHTRTCFPLPVTLSKPYQEEALQFHVLYFDQGAICIYVACIKNKKESRKSGSSYIANRKVLCDISTGVEESKLVTSINKIITHLRFQSSRHYCCSGAGRRQSLWKVVTRLVGLPAVSINLVASVSGSDPPVMHLILATALPLTNKRKDQGSKMSKK
jgi:hypothetical protein